MTVAKQQDKKNKGQKSALTTMDYVSIIADTFEELNSPEGKKSIIKAYKQSGLSEEMNFSAYRLMFTWKEGVQHRQNPLTQAYLEALFSKTNLSMDPADPFVLPLSVLDQEVSREVVMASEEGAIQEGETCRDINPEGNQNEYPSSMNKERNKERPKEKSTTKKERSVLITMMKVYQTKDDISTGMFYQWRLKGTLIRENSTVQSDLVNQLPEGEEISTQKDGEERIKSLLAPPDYQKVINRKEALMSIAQLLVQSGYVIQGGFVRDFVIHGDDPNDIDIISGIDATNADGKVALLVKFQEMKELILGKFLDLKIFNERSTSGVHYAQFTHSQRQNYVVEVQLIASVHAWIFPLADLTCNNLRLSKDQRIHLAGPSAWSLEETLQKTQRKEFGIQSGNLIPRIQQRAGARRSQGWTQVSVPEAPLPTGFGPHDLTENQKFVKGCRLQPTDELPLCWSSYNAWMMNYQHGIGQAKAKRKAEEQADIKQQEKRAKFAPTLEKGRQHIDLFWANQEQSPENASQGLKKITKDMWQSLLVYDLPNALISGNKPDLQKRYFEGLKEKESQGNQEEDVAMEEENTGAQVGAWRPGNQFE
jgi:hypothetical protein